MVLPSQAPCDPRELVGMMRKGDLRALDRMTRCHGERLLAVGRRYCRSDTEAHDAVQDALLSAGEHLEDFRGDGSVEGWLVRMVANACRRMRRGRKNDPALHIAGVALRDDDNDPEALTARGQLAEAIGKALLSLSPEDRTVLLLAEAEDWTGPEIAKAIGSTPAAVRTRLTRARARMRKELGQAQLELTREAVAKLHLVDK